MPTPDLESRFDHEMHTLYEQAKSLDYFGNRFKQILDKHGGPETARRLLAVSEPQEGLFRLWEIGALEMSVEAAVLKPEFRNLFTDSQILEAKRRLDELEFDTGAWMEDPTRDLEVESGEHNED